MEAALKHKVKKVILTSSIDAISNGNEKDSFNENSTAFNEGDWGNFAQSTNVFAKAKTLAETKFWEIYEKN